MAMGCAYNEGFNAPPSPLSKLAEVADVLQTVDERGYGERFPDEVAALQARYKAARLAYYSRSEGSGALSMSIIADANALMTPPPNQAPVAEFSGPPTGEANEAVSFDASASVDPEGDPLIYTWDFGDGTTQRVLWPQTEHRFAVARTYIVRLTVSDHQGESDTASQVIAIAQPPIMIPLPLNVLFEFDSADLQDEALAQLGTVVQTLKQRPSLQADVVGHTDSQGTEAYNLALSQRRAQAVSDHLITSGVVASRISTAWRGESEPAFPNSTAEFRILNRRVEVSMRP
jgi:outer membrane protein OmpA-like peptidoglycan-associated protein